MISRSGESNTGRYWLRMTIKFVIAFFVCSSFLFPAHASESAEKNYSLKQIPAKLLAGKPKQHNPAFFMSLKSVLMKLRQKRQLLFVDVRDASDFKRARIPGSINIPLFSLKTKTFLKSGTLILINKGFNYSQIERVCQRLRDAGFTYVWILAGGLRYWIQRGLPIEGNLFVQKSVNSISARDFYLERNYDNILVVDVSVAMIPKATRLMPRAVSVPYGKQTKRKFIDELMKMLRPHEGNPLMTVLFFNLEGAYPEEMQMLIRKTGISSVFYLKGGLNEYEMFLWQQGLIWQADNKRRMAKQCVNCP